MYYNYYRCPVVGISQDLLGKGKNKSKEKKNEKTSLLQFWSENSRTSTAFPDFWSIFLVVDVAF